MAQAAKAPELSAEQIRDVVEHAELAPSIHNTQPWRWRAAGGGLDLYADPSRKLEVVDPDGRQLLLSCGAALLNARLAVRSLGLVDDVTLVPAGGDELDLGEPAPPLATLRVAGTQPPDDTERELVAAMSRRHTDRRPFEPRPLESSLVRSLRRAAEAEGAWLLSLDRPDLRTEGAVLLARADWLETHDPAYQAELARWSRAEGERASDGIPRSSVVGHGSERQSEFLIRDFDVAGEPGLRIEHAEVERPTVILLGTDSDRAVDRLAAGQALQRVLLAVTAGGAAASPLGQVVDVESTRSLLSHTTGGMGHIQMVLRVGYPRQDAAALKPTPRRAVGDVLD